MPGAEKCVVEMPIDYVSNPNVAQDWINAGQYSYRHVLGIPVSMSQMLQ